MLEEEYNELSIYTIRASETIAQYYDKLENLTDKDRVYLIEKILSNVDLILVLTMNIRHQILIQLPLAQPTIKMQMNQSLNELKTTMETAKTLSFNFTAVLHATRDRINSTIE